MIPASIPVYQGGQISRKRGRGNKARTRKEPALRLTFATAAAGGGRHGQEGGGGGGAHGGVGDGEREDVGDGPVGRGTERRQPSRNS